MTTTKSPLMTPFWIRLAALGLIAPILIIAVMGTPQGSGVLFQPWLIWCAASLNAAAGFCLLVMGSRKGL